jgi:hypothetical protein
VTYAEILSARSGIGTGKHAGKKAGICLEIYAGDDRAAGKDAL